eukprot:CAMPEP_0118987254 /NCGR_PEP_ID=MMETSP1173-20130426/43829_1 /TAXON_ID=1034831 /ORGANISM="Rhizochromulina marina cf, Strain CCMP1243" /LENGTH=597 /DNA_ID=CAMNT_0006938089 /DNA_START=39 /DNA_END=1832 /DNA_ORIENTATION=-
MTSSLALKLALAQFQRGPAEQWFPGPEDDAPEASVDQMWGAGGRGGGAGGGISASVHSVGVHRPSLSSSASTFTTSSLSLGPITGVTEATNPEAIPAPPPEPHPMEHGKAEEKAMSLPLEPPPEVLQLPLHPPSWRVVEFNRASEVFPHYLPAMAVLPYATLKERQAIPRSDEGGHLPIQAVSASATVLFFSHTWWSGAAVVEGDDDEDDPPAAPRPPGRKKAKAARAAQTRSGGSLHPDNECRGKAQLVLSCIEQFASSRGCPPESVFVWIDFSCMDQNEAWPWPFMAAVSALPLWVALCDHFVYSPLYGTRNRSSNILRASHQPPTHQDDVHSPQSPTRDATVVQVDPPTAPEDHESRYSQRVWCRMEMHAAWYAQRSAYSRRLHSHLTHPPATLSRSASESQPTTATTTRTSSSPRRSPLLSSLLASVLPSVPPSPDCSSPLGTRSPSPTLEPDANPTPRGSDSATPPLPPPPSAPPPLVPAWSSRPGSEASSYTQVASSRASSAPSPRGWTPTQIDIGGGGGGSEEEDTFQLFRIGDEVSVGRWESFEKLPKQVAEHRSLHEPPFRNITQGALPREAERPPLVFLAAVLQAPP